jgi:hypothetical protein
VGADHGNGISRPPILANREGYDGGSISSEEVLSARPDFGYPGIAFSDLGKPGFLEEAGCGLHGMVRWMATH